MGMVPSGGKTSRLRGLTRQPLRSEGPWGWGRAGAKAGTRQKC